MQKVFAKVHPNRDTQGSAKYKASQVVQLDLKLTTAFPLMIDIMDPEVCITYILISLFSVFHLSINR